MTTLISWKANDTRGISSIYLASDSRFTWDNTKWDYGQKVYGCSKFPEIIGYCGDVLLSISIISSLIQLIDNEIIYKNNVNPNDKNRLVLKYIDEKFQLFPKNYDTTIIHIIKDSNNEFSYYEIKYSLDEHKWKTNKKEDVMNQESALIDAYGSGAKEYKDILINNGKCELNKTSRFYYIVFCETLSNIKDMFSGGAPQIMGLFRGRNEAIVNGVIWNEKRYLYGTQINDELNIENIEWRNENFERCDAFKNILVDGAQRQPRPKSMKKPL